MKRVSVFVCFFALFFALGFAGCKKQVVGGGVPDPGSLGIDFADEPSLRGDSDKDINLKTIYFDYDKSDLSPESLSALKENAAYINSNSGVNVLVEGHCDERGTTEYNLSLGQRRAVKVKEYYVQLGVAANRVATISYGEEKPADFRSNDSGWAKNRRAETKVMVRQ